MVTAPIATVAESPTAYATDAEAVPCARQTPPLTESHTHMSVTVPQFVVVFGPNVSSAVLLIVCELRVNVAAWRA